MNKPAVSVAKMQRMRRAIERDGLTFRGYRTYLDGSVEALAVVPLTEDAEAPSPIDPLDAELAEWDKTHGHG